MAVSGLTRTLAAACTFVMFAGPMSVCGVAQESDAVRISPPRIAVTEFDSKAAANVSHVRVHVTPAAVPGAKELANALNRIKSVDQDEALNSEVTAKTVPSPTGPFFYPADMVSSKGKLVKSAQSHAIYVNCTPIAKCWGNPEGFLTDLGKSSFIHVADQYVGATANNRYTVGKNATVSYSHFGTTFYPEDLFSIVHAVAKTDGTGYGHIYHILDRKSVV